jgi:hypothetical protein
MQDHPSPDRGPGAAPPGEDGDEAQRQVLLELVTDPPPGGEDAALLAARLGLRTDRVLAALAALSAAGLAACADGMVRATAAARRFDALWPIEP